uniref:E3 ubiquitin protein ligase RIE1-like n=1 Tax=Erigeron canadensis TaxID=72917 RepID=UPI001CB90D88|nr:E3 ubiquitin protein ligase RIE1-like [Erigeron canadensis]
MATTVPEIIVVIEPENQDDIAAPETVTSTLISSTLRGLFVCRILVSSVLTGFFYNFHEPNWLENWRANFGPVVVIETIRKLILTVVSVVILSWSAVSNERNVFLFRVLISFYLLQCVVDVVLMWKEYYTRSNSAVPTQISSYRRWDMSISPIWCPWSVIAILWMLHNNFHFKILLNDAPRLFWLTLGFLVSSETFLAGLIVIFCTMVLFMFISFGKARIFFEGASENYISALPNYIFELPNCVVELSNSVEQNDGKAGRMMPVETNDPDWSNEIPTDDVDCSICLDLYENGSEINLLPCKHNFHAACIRKWLSIKRICPLCKQELK